MVAVARDTINGDETPGRQASSVRKMSSGRKVSALAVMLMEASGTSHHQIHFLILDFIKSS